MQMKELMESYGKKISFFNKIYNYFKKKEKEFLQFSDYTISLTKTGKKKLNLGIYLIHLKSR